MLGNSLWRVKYLVQNVHPASNVLIHRELVLLFVCQENIPQVRKRHVKIVQLISTAMHLKLLIARQLCIHPLEITIAIGALQDIVVIKLLERKLPALVASIH